MITHIDIISDPNCPFCALGVLQLQKALEETGQSAAHLKWHPFLINPHLPPEGIDARENLKAKYGMSAADIEAGFDRFKMQGEAFGFEYNYPDGKRVYPSDRAHQLVAWVPEDLKTEAYFALMAEFFTKSNSFYELDVLAEVANKLGLDGNEARRVIESGEYADSVNEQVKYWQQQGVQGVPSFVMNDTYFLSGAIGVEGFKNVFAQIQEQELA